MVFRVEYWGMRNYYSGRENLVVFSCINLRFLLIVIKEISEWKREGLAFEKGREIVRFGCVIVGKRTFFLSFIYEMGEVILVLFRM